MTQITDERRFTRPQHTTTAVSPEAVENAIRHTTLRALGFGGMLGIALLHLLDVIGKIKETPYLGVMYIGLMVASVAVAFYLLHTGAPRAWAAAGLLAAATLAGFVLSRTTGLPNASDDVGPSARWASWVRSSPARRGGRSLRTSSESRRAPWARG